MRSHYCGELDASHIGAEIEVCGWVHRRRDHGGVIFLDLRDHTGILQLVFDPDSEQSFAVADRVRSEYVLRMTGTVRARPEGSLNPDMKTGEIEVLGRGIEILNASETPPFQLDEYSDAGEDVRLHYRYLDLRRDQMQQRLRMRAHILTVVRGFLEGEGFVDVETPILTRATPEGARDYLVPSRTHPGQFFALPQSPQIFKQLLMMSGVDRYYQIARCFRDEDLRADRQPEFTQIDLEASFVEESDVMSLAERMLDVVFKEVLDIDLPEFPIFTHAEVLRRFGSDKPDLRNPIELVDIADLMKEVEFKVFSGPARDPDGRVVAMRAPGAARLSRKQVDDYGDFVARYGARGLAWIKINERSKGIEGMQSPILKFLPAEVVEEVLNRCGAENGDLVFFGSDNSKVVNDALGALRNRLGQDLELIEDRWAPCWVVDWPMFERDREGRLESMHHPFTSPACSESALRADPLKAPARAYDVVLNGHEVGGGSIRIHRSDLQQAVFEVLNVSQEEQSKFGFLLDALKHGCPPHGGIAFGVDRLVMLMTGTDAIRDVIAFPKTQSAACLMTAAPSEVDEPQLRELNIRIRKN